MTVQELINELNNIEDKDMTVSYRYGASGAINSVEINKETKRYLTFDTVTKVSALITD